MSPGYLLNIRSGQRSRSHGSQSTKRRPRDQRQLCTLSSAQPLVQFVMSAKDSIFKEFVLDDDLQKGTETNVYYKKGKV